MRLILVLIMVFGSLFSVCNGHCQTINFDGKNDEQGKIFKPYVTIKNIINLKENGFLAITGVYLNGTVMGKLPDDIIWYFSKEGKLVWKNSVDEDNHLLVSPDNSTLYCVKINEKFYSKKTKIRKIDVSSNKETTYEIEGKQEFGKSLQNILCDNNYLYLVATQEGDELHDRKKVNEKLLLNRFDAQTFSYTRFVIDTPPIEEGEENSFWSFIGQKEDVKFFCSKQASTDLNTFNFNIIGILSSGAITSKVSFSSKLLNNKFRRPAINFANQSNDVYNFKTIDYGEKFIRDTGGGMVSTYTKVISFKTAFSQITYDNVTNSFLVYGLFGDNPFEKIGRIGYSGLYLGSFDMNGQKIWYINHPTNTLVDNANLRVDDRYIRLFKTYDAKIGLNVSFKKIDASFLFSTEGKFIDSQLLKDAEIDLDNFGRKKDIKLANYLKPFAKDKNGIIKSIVTPDGEIVIRFSNKEKVFQTIYFKRS
jgi:hypothetical protein